MKLPCVVIISAENFNMKSDAFIFVNYSGIHFVFLETHGVNNLTKLFAFHCLYRSAISGPITCERVGAGIVIKAYMRIKVTHPRFNPRTNIKARIRRLERSERE